MIEMTWEIKLFYLCMLAIQTLLIVPETLRRKGIIFYGVGFAIRFNVKQNFETKAVKLNALEKIIIANSICIVIASTIGFIWFTKDFYFLNVYSVPLGEKTHQVLKKFIEHATLIDLYIMSWLVALIIGLPHEYMHIYFGKRCHVRTKSVYVATIMGFPILLFVDVDMKKAKPLQKAFVASAGLISNIMLFFIATTLYFIFPENIISVLAFYITLSITLMNGTILLFYVDGSRVVIETLKASGKDTLSVLYLLVLYILLIMYIIL